MLLEQDGDQPLRRDEPAESAFRVDDGDRPRPETGCERRRVLPIGPDETEANVPLASSPIGRPGSAARSASRPTTPTRSVAVEDGNVRRAVERAPWS